ncbi:MAG: EamA family transporter RarD [Actinomycetia bacterium]|nr:EamA family transporter RarD [Actinomycetes bacterium]
MQARRGTWYAVGAYVLWGLSPLFWNLIPDIAAIDLLLNRIVWSVPLLAIVLGLSRRWSEVQASYRPWRTRFMTVAASGFVLINWGLFLWAATNGHILEASLGYFINPLVSVALGVVVLGERLRRLQWIAVGIAALGVIAMTIRLGELPWISLVLAGAFGMYGLIKKQPITPAPVVSLFGESAFLALPALIIGLAVTRGGAASFGSTLPITIFLISTGIMNVVPLLLFGAAAKRIPLSTIGLLQYITPTLQFVLGILVYEETLSGDGLFGFIVVWIALGIYTFDTFRGRGIEEPVAQRPEKEV